MTNAIARVRAALLAYGHSDTIVTFPEGTRTSADAAAAIGCDVAQIAKSMIFRARGSDRPVLVIASGANRIDRIKASALTGDHLTRADPEWVLATTGFAVGGVSPVGHLTPPLVLMDQDLLPLDPVWAAAGSADSVFRTSTAELVRMTGAAPGDVAAA